MSILVALLFPAIGALALALTAACVALMIHYKYPRQRSLASAETGRLPVWVETNPEPEAMTEQPSRRREFVEIRRVHS